MTPEAVVAAGLRKKDLLGIADLTADEIRLILDTADAMREIGERPIKKVPTLRGKTVVNLFFEASTRTRTSFEIAEKRLSADTLNIAASTSSVLKGETLVDTALNLEAMAPDMIVLRHPSSGAWHLLARICRSRIINAGDGMHEHPTQALLDAFTIRAHKPRFAGLKVAIIGDLLHSRVLRSNVLAAHQAGRRRVGVRPVDARARRHRATGRAGDDVGGRGRGGRRRRDDASHPAGTHARRVRPVAARVLHRVRSDRRACGPRQARRHHHAPRSDEPGRGDRRRRRRRPVLRDSRAGRQRRRRPHGGVVSAGRRRRGWKDDPAQGRACGGSGQRPGRRVRPADRRRTHRARRPRPAGRRRADRRGARRPRGRAPG